MSLHYERDGSVTLQSDADWRVTHRIAPGATNAEVDAAYATFLVSNPRQRQQIYTSLDFINLFTQLEQLALAATLQQNPALFVWFTKMLAAASVDATAPETVAAVSALATAGVITQTRAREIAPRRA
jgi:hypothetical protein